MTSGVIFDIQHYSVYDGPGIRTTVFFKGCPLSCAWCHNPESQRLNPEVGYLVDRCVRCGKCVEACPNKSLSLYANGVGRDRSRCTACGACAAACLSGATQMIGRRVTPKEVLEAVVGDRPFYDFVGGRSDRIGW